MVFFDYQHRFSNPYAMTDRKTPPHMRDNPSDDEYDFADASASETGAGDTGSITSETISKEGKVPGGSMGKGGDMGVKTLEKILKRKAQVGEVEIDPQIGEHTDLGSACCYSRLMVDYTDFTEEGPGLSSRAAMTDEGMINIWVDLKQSVPDLHKDYAVPVKEYGTDPSGGEDCPPLNIVIFIVGSRGEIVTMHDDKCIAHVRRRAAVPYSRAEYDPFARPSHPDRHASGLQRLRARRGEAPEGCKREERARSRGQTGILRHRRRP